MKLFGINISVSRSQPSTTPPLQRSFTPEQWLRGEDLDSRSSTLSNAYQQVVWVYRAINVLAEQVANIPFLFSAGDRGRETLITTGQLRDFYNRPHAGMNRFQYWELRVIWLMLRGECFRVPIYSDDHNLNHNLSLNRSHSLSACTPNAFGAGGEGRGEVAPSRSDTPTLQRSNAPRRHRLKSIVFLDPSHCHHI